MKLRILPPVLLVSLAGVFLITAHAQNFVPAPAPGTTDSSDTQSPPPPAGPNGGTGGPHGDPKARLEEHLHRLTEALDLTADQQAEIAALLKKEAEELHDLFQSQDLSPEDKRAQFQEIREKFHARIDEVLTPEQREKFQRLPEHGPGPGGPGANVPKPSPAS